MSDDSMKVAEERGQVPFGDPSDEQWTETKRMIEGETINDESDKRTRSPGPGTLEALVGEDFAICWRAAVELRALWDLYLGCFTSKKAVDVLNRGAGFAAWAFQRSLVDNLLVSICRISEPAGTQKLTIRKLEKAITPDFTAQEVAALNRIISEIDIAIKPIKDHRDNRISHTNIEHARAGYAELLPLERNDIERVVTLLCEFMSVYCKHYGPILNFEVEEGKMGANQMLTSLQMGLKADEVCIRVLRGRSISAEEAIDELEKTEWPPGAGSPLRERADLP